MREQKALHGLRIQQLCINDEYNRSLTAIHNSLTARWSKYLWLILVGQLTIRWRNRIGNAHFTRRPSPYEMICY
jgi:hypothetical protein